MIRGVKTNPELSISIKIVIRPLYKPHECLKYIRMNWWTFFIVEEKQTKKERKKEDYWMKYEDTVNINESSKRELNVCFEAAPLQRSVIQQRHSPIISFGPTVARR